MRFILFIQGKLRKKIYFFILYPLAEERSGPSKVYENEKKAVWDKTPLRNLIYYMVNLEGCEQNNRVGLEAPKAAGLRAFYCVP
jgi:hypothetical protein